MINPMELTGKHILITGASSGIGRALAILADALGAKLTLVARSKEKLNETISDMKNLGIHRVYTQDLRALEELESFFKRLVEDQGKIDGFVHCAGIAPIRPISLTKAEFMDDVMKINFYAFVECIRLLSKKKMSNDGASFIAISSVAAHKGDKSQGAYAASKAALEGIVRPVAKEFSTRRMRMNAIEFGMINTGLYQYFKDSGGEDSALSSQYLGIGEPEDAARIIAFLLSDASRFVTGSVLVADGGYLS